MSKNDDERIGLCPCPRTMTNSTNSPKGSRFPSPLMYGIRIRKYGHTFYNILLRIPFNSILWWSPYTVSLTHSVVYVKWLDNQIIWYWISAICLIIKGLDNQDQKLNYQIKQYPPKSLIVNLAKHRLSLLDGELQPSVSLRATFKTWVIKISARVHAQFLWFPSPYFL